MLADKNLCTGCGACAAGCPLHCIEMQADREGFRYPVVDTNRCVSCHKCESACPVLNIPLVQTEPHAYGVKHKDDRIRGASSSGGVFPALAQYVLENGGAVCGAVYSDNFTVEHQIIENAAEICKLQGAKYAQSCVERLFPRIKDILDADRWLLFAGTPCQVAGLQAYLGKHYGKLILVDMICHGVPSPKVWARYLQERSQLDATGADVAAVNLRNKESGWSRYGYSVVITYANGKKYCVPQGEDLFMQGFVQNLYLRPSCANCAFKGLDRCSDLTLGDFWGIWDIYPEFDDDRGVSLLLVHTQAGAEVWEAVCSDFAVQKVECSTAVACNPSALASSIPHPMRQEFFDKPETESVISLIRGCLYPERKKPSLFRRIWNRLQR